MAFFKLCTEDPVVSELRNVFRANILRIPEERIAPLTVLASTRGSARFLGHVGSLLSGPPFKMSSDDLKESDMATMANRRSRELDSEFGVQILSGLLQGMGTGPIPDVSAILKEARKFRFHFPAVRRNYVEIARIGQLLAGRTFDNKNLLFRVLLDQQTTVRLIDSVITSTGFDIEIGDESKANFKIDTQRLQKELVDAKIEVVAKGAKFLSLHSKRRLTFAFTCVNVGILANGAIRAIAPSSDKLDSPQLADPRGRERGLESHVLLTRSAELIEWEIPS